MSLPNAVLGILTYSPMTGYNLGKIFANSINNIWTASLSQIYRELVALEKKGHVSSSIEQQDDKPAKKIYSITEDGRTAFLQWLTDFPEAFPALKRDDFALRIFFGSKVGNQELIKQFKRFVVEREQFRKMMDKSRRAFMESNNFVLENQIGEAIKENEVYLSLIIRRAFISNDGLIRWAKECIEELEKLEESKRSQ